MGKEFECKPKCESIRIKGIYFDCDNCIKHKMFPLTEEEAEKILAILEKRDGTPS